MALADVFKDTQFRFYVKSGVELGLNVDLTEPREGRLNVRASPAPLRPATFFSEV